MGKDNSAGARGHSSLFGALDTSMTLKKFGQHDIQLICDKQKDAPEFDTLQFCFVTLGGDDDTPVLHLVPTSKVSFGPKLGKNEQLAMDTFAEATNEKLSPCTNSRAATRQTHVFRHVVLSPSMPDLVC